MPQRHLHWILAMTMTRDEQIADSLLTRQIDIVRVEVSINADCIYKLEQLQQQIELLLGAANLSTLTKVQLNTLLSQVKELIKAFYEDLSNTMQQLASDLANDEVNYLVASLLVLGVPNTANLKSQNGKNILVGGLTLQEIFNAQYGQIFISLKQQIRVGSINGEKPDLTNTFKKAKNWIKATTPTITNSIINNVIYQYGLHNSAAMGWRHISVMDAHTSVLCAVRNGALWDKEQNPVNHALAFQIPPLHNRCRSRLVPVFDLNADFTGVTAANWVSKRSLKQLQEQFGRGLGFMLKNKQITLSDAIKNGGLQPMTLKELREKTP